MDWEVLYYRRISNEVINTWPVGVRAYYARITKHMQSFGPNLGMPFTRSMGQGLFESVQKAKRASVELSSAQ